MKKKRGAKMQPQVRSIADGVRERVGRPPLGAGLVDQLPAVKSAESDCRAEAEKLRVIMETLTGERTIAEACAALGIGESRFFELRTRALTGAVEALRPGAPGRPVKAAASAPTREEYERLKDELDEVQAELMASRLREELAIVFPRLGAKKKPR